MHAVSVAVPITDLVIGMFASFVKQIDSTIADAAGETKVDLCRR